MSECAGCPALGHTGPPSCARKWFPDWLLRDVGCFKKKKKDSGPVTKLPHKAASPAMPPPSLSDTRVPWVWTPFKKGTKRQSQQCRESF